MGSAGESCISFPSGVRAELRPQSHFAVLNALKTHLDATCFGSLVSIAMSGNMKAKPLSQSHKQAQVESSIAVNLRHINIIVVQTGKLIFCKVRNCGPPKFCGPVRPNTSNMPKSGPATVCSKDLSL